MTPNCDQLSGAQALVPYTGYYTIDGGSGAFVMVDPYMTVASAPGKAPVNTYLARSPSRPMDLIQRCIKLESIAVSMARRC